MRYSIDTSAILDAWIRGFPPDVVPGFWERFEELIDIGQLIATEEVLYELKKKPFSGRNGHIDEIGAHSFSIPILAQGLYRREEILDIINGDKKAVFKGNPAVVVVH